MSDLECALTAERTRRISDAEEWKQFQADLLMTVRVAKMERDAWVTTTWS